MLLPARERGVVKLGTVALGEAKMHATASRHSALSYEHAGKLAAPLKAEAAVLLATAEGRIFRAGCRSRKNWSGATND